MSLVITYKGNDLNFPTSFDLLSQDQFLFIASRFLRDFNTDDKEFQELSEFRFSLLQKLTGLPWHRLTSLTKDEVADIQPYVDFVFGDFDLSECVFQSFWYRGRKYHGPNKSWSNLKFEELATADTYFIKFIKTRDEDYLLKLLSVLYRTKVMLRQKRRKFSSQHLEKNWQKFQGVPYEYLAGALYSWWGFRENVMIKTFPNIFPKPEGKDVKRVGNNYGWAATITETAGTKFGDIEATKDQDWIDVFVYMSMELDKANKL